MDKLKGLLGMAGADKVQAGLDKAGDMVDEKTGGAHSDKIDMAKDKVGEMIEGAHDAAAE